MSFDEAYRLYYSRLYAFAYQYTLSKQNSEDLVGETFSRFLQELKSGIEIINIQSWLYKVLINLLHTAKAHEKKGTEVSKEIVFRSTVSESFESKLLMDEKRNIVNKELNSLPDNEKALLILYNRGFKYEEIASILDMKTSSVGTTLARAITKFRENLIRKYNGLFE